MDGRNIGLQYGKGEHREQIKDVSKKDLKNIYGCYSDSPKKGDKWNAILKVSWVADGEKEGNPKIGGAEYQWKVTINEIYAGPDKNEEDYKYGKNLKDDEGKKVNFDDINSTGEDLKNVADAAGGIINTVGETVTDIVDKAVDLKDGVTAVTDWVGNFMQNPYGTIVGTLMDFFIAVGDVVQWISNSIQTDEANTVNYKYDELKKDKSKNIYTNVAKSSENKETNAIVEINIEKDKNSNKVDDYTKETKIPVIVGDLYNIAVGHLNFLDANFLTGKQTVKSDGSLVHEENSAWVKIRDVISGLIRICIYVTSAILIIFLIANGIKIVSKSLDNPSSMAQYKKNLEKFKTALGMLIGSIIIMALCIFGSKGLCSMISTDTYELPIRVNVEDTYSFSTTAIGYVRYMAGIEDVDQWLQKVFCTIFYLVLEICNVLVVFIMILRVILLWGLSVIGPLTAIAYIFNIQSFVSFGNWAKSYIFMSSIQFVMVVIYYMILVVVAF